jgi:biotin carboxyl carrier protein
MAENEAHPKISGPQPRRGESGVSVEGGDKFKALAVGLETARRLIEAPSFEDVRLFLVNDLRAFVEFDRCFLILHLGGSSRVVSATNQPELDAKSKLLAKVEAFCEPLRNQKRAVLLTLPCRWDDPNLPELSPQLKAALKDFADNSPYSFLFVVPLVHDDSPVGTLVMEFPKDAPPDQARVVALLHTSPILASVLVQRWLFREKPRLAEFVRPPVARGDLKGRPLRNPWALMAIAAVVFLTVAFTVPITYTVGGPLEIAPWERHSAFSAVEGLIERVSAHEGATVSEGEALAFIDPAEIEFKIAGAMREGEILAKQAELLGIEADMTPAKLAEAKLTELKRAKVRNDLLYLEWLKGFLTIRSPVAGIVVTKDIESLAGKKLRAGEQFCEIAVPDDIAADTLVPEDKIMLVKTGQTLRAYLNQDPFTGRTLKVDEVSPLADPVPGLGNVCRVRARFPDPAHTVKVGMKGVGKIDVEPRTLASIAARRAVMMWNMIALRF